MYATFHAHRLPDPAAVLRALLRLDPLTRAALTRAIDLADEAAQRGDRAVYARVLMQQRDGEPLPRIAATLEAERDRDDF